MAETNVANAFPSNRTMKTARIWYANPPGGRSILIYFNGRVGLAQPQKNKRRGARKQKRRVAGTVV